MFGGRTFGQGTFAAAGGTVATVIIPAPAIVDLATSPGGNQYVVGDLVALIATFIDPTTDEPVKPTVVQYLIHEPQGLLTAVTPVQTGLGTYVYNQAITNAGLWRWSVIGTGAYQAADDAEFEARAI